VQEACGASAERKWESKPESAAAEGIGTAPRVTVPMPSRPGSAFVVFVFVVFVFVVFVFVDAADQQLFGSGGAIGLLVAALLKESLQLVVTGALRILDVLLASLNALQSVVQDADERVLVVFGLFGRIQLRHGLLRLVFLTLSRGGLRHRLAP
jgi:hypothetical protein